MNRTETKALLFCLVVILAVLWLSGCAANCPVPEPKVVTQEVDKPVAVNCLKNVPTIPDYETEYLDPDTADGEVLLELTRNWVKAQAYEASQRASQAGCAALPPAPAAAK